jgi:2TM domain
MPTQLLVGPKAPSGKKTIVRSLIGGAAYPRGLARTLRVEASARSEEELREQAIARLKKKRDFRAHVFMYVAVNALLVVIWAVTSGPNGFFWPVFPILGWGIGVAANGWDVYGRKPISEEEIRRETDRLRG